MKRFLYKVVIFPMFLVFYFGLNAIINFTIYNNPSIPIQETSVLIVGDSHPQKSLNPKYFNDAQNISQPAEPYILTYWKLKSIFKSYTPDTLIIGLAPHNISQFNDLKFSNKKWSNEMFRRSYPIQDFRNISNEISVDYSTYTKVLWKQTAFYPKKNHIHFLGNYSNSKNTDVKDTKSAIERHYYDNGKELGVSESAVNYLDSIIDISSSKGIVLIMVSNPVHEHYLSNIPNAIMEKYDNLTKKYSINHIVYNKTKDIYPDSLYLNSDHLNEYGAKKFSIELSEYLKNKARTHNIGYK